MHDVGYSIDEYIGALDAVLYQSSQHLLALELGPAVNDHDTELLPTVMGIAQDLLNQGGTMEVQQENV